MTEEQQIELAGLRELRDSLSKENQKLSVKWKTAHDVADCLQEQHNMLLEKIVRLEKKMTEMKINYAREREVLEQRLKLHSAKNRRLTLRLAEHSI